MSHRSINFANVCGDLDLLESHTFYDEFFGNTKFNVNFRPLYNYYFNKILRVSIKIEKNNFIIKFLSVTLRSNRMHSHKYSRNKILRNSFIQHLQAAVFLFRE